MTVILTSPAEGLQPGASYTGPNEAWLLASGYARKTAGPFTGPGLDATGPSDTTIAANREFTPGPVHQIAATSDLPVRGTNDGIVLKDPSAPFISLQGDAFGPEAPVAFTGFANDPAVFPLDPAKVTLTPASGPAAGGTVVQISGSGFNDVTGVLFDTTAGASFVRNSRTSITVTSPAHVAGAVSIVLQRTAPKGGNVAKANGFTYTA